MNYKLGGWVKSGVSRPPTQSSPTHSIRVWADKPKINLDLLFFDDNCIFPLGLPLLV